MKAVTLILKMKRLFGMRLIPFSLYLFLTFNFQLLTCNCFSQDWQWAKNIGSSVMDYGSCISDNSGNIYITCGGWYASSQLPEPTHDNNVPFYSLVDTLQPANQQNVYLLKLDSNGNQLWVKQFSWSVYSSSFCDAAIGQPVYDSINNVVYIYGTFKGTITLGSTQLVGSTTAINMYIAQFDLNGNCIWAKQAGSSSSDYEFISSLSVDKFGNVYICGNNDNNASFDSFIVPYGSFLAKYNSAGTCLWAQKKINRSIYTASPIGIKIYDSTLYITGVAKGTLVVDTITATYSSSWYLYLTAFDLDGHVKKLKTFGLGCNIRGNIGIDNNRNFYITGSFSGVVQFDTITITSSSQSDAFFAKLDSNFNFKWVKQTSNSGTYPVSGLDVYTNNSGSSYFIGYFGGNASFGNYNITGSSGFNIFLVRYDSNGDCKGILHFAGGNDGRSITVDNTGNPVIVGSWAGGTIGSTTLPNYGPNDVFIAKAYPINTGINDLKISQNNLLTIYANPNDGNCNITVPEEFQNEKKLILNIFDTKGNQIQQAHVEMLNDKIKVSIEAEAKGIYNAVLTNGKKSYSGKIIFE